MHIQRLTIELFVLQLRPSYYYLFYCSVITFIQEVNEEWLSDKGRFSYDGLHRQRLVEPMLREPDGALNYATWEDVLVTIGERFLSLDESPDQVAAVVGPFVDAETMITLKDLANRFNSELLFTEESFPVRE